MWLDAAQALSHHKLHRPAFFSSAHRKFINYPDTPKDYRTIPAASQHFE